MVRVRKEVICGQAGELVALLGKRCGVTCEGDRVAGHIEQLCRTQGAEMLNDPAPGTGSWRVEHDCRTFESRQRTGTCLTTQLVQVGLNTGSDRSRADPVLEVRRSMFGCPLIGFNTGDLGCRTESVANCGRQQPNAAVEVEVRCNWVKQRIIDEIADGP